MFSLFLSLSSVWKNVKRCVQDWRSWWTENLSVWEVLNIWKTGKMCRYEEKISWISNTANVNRKTVDSNGIWTSHLREHRRPAALSVELSSHWEQCAHVMQFKCMRYSCDDLTLSVRIYSVSILLQNHPQRNMKRKFHDFLTLLMSRENLFFCWR